MVPVRSSLQRVLAGGRTTLGHCRWRRSPGDGRSRSRACRDRRDDLAGDGRARTAGGFDSDSGRHPLWPSCECCVGSVVSVLDLRARSEDPLVLTWTNRAASLSRIVVS